MPLQRLEKLISVGIGFFSALHKTVPEQFAPTQSTVIPFLSLPQLLTLSLVGSAYALKGIKKAPPIGETFLSLCWHYLSSRQVTLQVLSAQMSLTSVFGMGTGEPSSQSIPTMSDEVSPILFYVKALSSSNRFSLLSLISFPFPIQSPAQRV